MTVYQTFDRKRFVKRLIHSKCGLVMGKSEWNFSHCLINVNFSNFLHFIKEWFTNCGSGPPSQDDTSELGFSFYLNSLILPWIKCGFT